MTVTYYVGVRRDGASATGGGVIDDVPGFVQARFRARWRRLVVTRDGDDVGGITRDPATGRRVWWAESLAGGEGESMRPAATLLTVAVEDAP